MDNMGKVC